MGSDIMAPVLVEDADGARGRAKRAVEPLEGGYRQLRMGSVHLMGVVWT